MKNTIYLPACIILAAAATAAPPRHVVIVIEENHSYSQIIGSASAPYINQLAAQGASFTSMQGVSHPSQPSYLAFYSGDFQGVFDDGLTLGAPYSTPNLGAELLAAGRTFATYSEGLPSEGSLVNAVGAYRRRHNPASNWQSATPGVNQYGPSLNKPLTAFPTDFSLLPTVSYVVPDQNHNMHDGTIEEADAWLAANIGPYADWVMANDSLLIVTFDEDNGAERNRIATIFYGPMVKTGTVDSTWNLYSLLRTIEDMYGTRHAGAAALSRPIVGAMKDDAAYETVSFRRGVNGYAAMVDTRIDAAAPDTAFAGETLLSVKDTSQGLIRFDGIIGDGAGKVPAGAVIVAAKLVMYTGSTVGGGCFTPISACRMRVAWDGASTWNSLGNGVSCDGIEAAAAPDFTLIPYTRWMWTTFDVSESVQAWVNGTEPNLGWVITGTTADDWLWPSSEATTLNDRPRLEISYATGVVCPAIETQPLSTAACLGGEVSFSVGASGTSLTYEWRHDGVPIPDATGEVLTISGATAGDAGLYYCVVSNACGPVASTSAELQVCISDFNCDGGIDGTDVQAFFEAWENATPIADVNADGGIDGTDVSAFFSAWEAGTCR